MMNQGFCINAVKRIVQKGINMNEKSKETLEHLGLWALATLFGLAMAYAFKDLLPNIECVVLVACLWIIGWMLYLSYLVKLARRFQEPMDKAEKRGGT